MNIVYIIKYPSGSNSPIFLEWWINWFEVLESIRLQISSFYTLFLWVPQHLLAGLFIIVIFFIIFKTKGNKWLRSILIGLVLSAAFGYSTFAALGILIPYTLWNLNSMLKNKKISREFILSIAVFLVSSSYLIYLYTSKNSILSIRLVSGSFLSGFDQFNLIPVFLVKTIDFFITIPLYLLIEMGIIQFIGIILAIMWRKKFITSSESQFWLLTFISTFPLVFFLSSINKNDFGMRFIIPAQIALAILTGIVFESTNVWKRKSYLILLAVIILVSTTMPLFEFKVKTFNNLPKIDPLLLKIDSETPLSSVIFTDLDIYDFIPAYAHRFTFYPPPQ